MKIALPQLPAKLEPLSGLTGLIEDDETISTAVFRAEDISGLVTRSFTANEVRFERLQATQSQLVRTSFSDVEFSGCALIATAFPESSWRRVLCKESRCSGMQLQNSILKDITFAGCKLNMVNFRFCDLFNITFKDCMLDEADFYGASLKNIRFQNCTLQRTQFSTAKLSKADFRTSDITGVLGVSSFAGAIIDSLQLLAIAPVLAQEFKITIKDD
jgi:uncharacterized protein YjbI with pentapeptide repeats